VQLLVEHTATVYRADVLMVKIADK